jgi:cytoskeletal protein RodZ
MAKKSKRAVFAENGHLSLRDRRLRKGLTLEQIADSTKISIRFLRAIEAEEFEQLPGGIFNTSYLRQYAAAIGYDEGKLLAYYDEQTKPSNAEMMLERRESKGLLRWFRTSAVAGR